MTDWLMVGGISVVAFALFWMRAAFVSLNKDMRVILDRQAEVRERLAELEAKIADQERALARRDPRQSSLL